MGQRLNDRQIDEILSGQTPLREGPFAEIARHLADARSQLVQAPDEVTQEAHLAAIVKAARETTGQTWSAPERHRPSPIARIRMAAVRLGAAVVATSLSTMGLAYAGVDLPGTAAEKIFDRVGIELPNQGPEDSGKSVADDVKDVIENTEERDCKFGRAVSEAASQNRKGEGAGRTEPCRERSEKAGRAKGDAGKERAEERSNGNAKANEAPRGGKKGKGDAQKGKGRSAGRKHADETPGKGRSKDKDKDKDKDKAKANPAPDGRGNGNGSERPAPNQGDGSGKGNGDEASSAGKGRAEKARSRSSASDVVDAVDPDNISETAKGAGNSKK